MFFSSVFLFYESILFNLLMWSCSNLCIKFCNKVKHKIFPSSVKNENKLKEKILSRCVEETLPKPNHFCSNLS